MATFYEEHIVKIKERKPIKKICDRCGIEITVSSGRTIERVFDLCFLEEIRLDEGSRYIEGWRVEDMCDDCIKLLKAWLMENNVKLQEKSIGDM